MSVAIYCAITFCDRDSLWKRNWLPKAVAALFFAFAMVFGWAFANYDSAAVLFQGKTQCVKVAINYFAWAVIGYLLASIFIAAIPRVGNTTISSLSTNSRLYSFIKIYKKHPFLSAFLGLNLIWLPAFVGYLPGLFMGDTPTQIRMWFNMPNYHSDLLSLINPNVTLSQHHPVFHTAILGICVQAGQVFGNANLGLMTYTFLQWEITIAAIAFSVMVLSQEKCSRHVAILVYLFYAIVPIYSLYACLITKDSMFAAFLLAFISYCWKMRKCSRPTMLHWVLFIFLAVFVCLLRNGGLLFALGGFVAVAIAFPHQLKRIACCSLSLVIVFASFSYLLLPSLEITPGSKREILSIPFQQVARYVATYPDELTADEIEKIDAILGYGTLAERYDPNLSDSVKDKFNENASKDQMSGFWQAWASLGLRHPEVYISAVINNYYGYFYLTDSKSNIYSVQSSEVRIVKLANETTFDFHVPNNPVSRFLGKVNTIYFQAFESLPIVKIVMSAPFYSWVLILLTLFSIVRKKKDALVLLLVPWLVFLVVLIGPSNSVVYFRYMYPIALCIPFVAGALFSLAVGVERRYLEKGINESSVAG